MAAITIRKLDDQLKHRLRIRAAAHGRSMEAEAREILSSALQAPNSDEPADNRWVFELMKLGEEFGGIELHIPPRSVDDSRIPDFSEH